MFGIEAFDNIIVIITLYLVFNLICKARDGDCLLRSQEKTDNKDKSDNIFSTEINKKNIDKIEEHPELNSNQKKTLV